MELKLEVTLRLLYLGLSCQEALVRQRGEQFPCGGLAALVAGVREAWLR